MKRFGLPPFVRPVRVGAILEAADDGYDGAPGASGGGAGGVGAPKLGLSGC